MSRSKLQTHVCTKESDIEVIKTHVIYMREKMDLIDNRLFAVATEKKPVNLKGLLSTVWVGFSSLIGIFHRG